MDYLSENSYHSPRIFMHPYIRSYHYIIYARGVKDKPLASDLKYGEWKEKNSVDSFLVADGSPDGFFQLTVFRVLAGQFYLFWHANYRDTTIVTTTDEMNATLSLVKRDYFHSKVTDEQLSSMKAINPQPTVEVSDDRASVTYCTFTKWGGISRVRDSYLRLPPHQLIRTDVLAEVKYDCGICF